ncbi:MAG: S8 family serine peptidase [Bacteroidia bacterium]
MQTLRVLLCAGWISTLACTQAAAQTCYLVSFTDKDTAACFDPAGYLDAAALAHRKALGLPAYDDCDMPLRPGYVATVAGCVDSLRYQLRWLNAVSVQATPAQVALLAGLPFVAGIEPLGLHEVQLTATGDQPPRYDSLLHLVRDQLYLDSLAVRGLTGAGVRVAILDAGFREADTHPALADARARGQILHTYDFFAAQTDVYTHSWHGTEVVSCVAGRYADGRPLGAAPDALLLLARVEHERRERPAEEDHWIAALEWAARLGAQIVSSSVNYTTRYRYADMDGRTTPVSRAAALAAGKGVLVVCAMGNEGDSKWRYMGAPADVPSVLSVGASLPMLREHIPFASIGPNARNETKPDLAAPGFMLTAWKRGRYAENAGTSFSTPLVAGLAACLLQQQPDKTPAALAQQLRELGHLYPYYDYKLGYGVPDCRRILADSLWRDVAPTFIVSYPGDSVVLAFDPIAMRQDSAAHPFGKILYYHLEMPGGGLAAYQQIRIPTDARYYYFRRSAGSTGILRIWFEGYLYEQRW